MITEAVYDHLKADAGITALVSSVYPTLVPLGVDPPFLVYTLDVEERGRLLDGTESGYRMATFTIDCYAETLSGAVAIADAVVGALVDYTGTLGTTSPSVTADHVRLERRGPHLFENDTGLHRVELEFLIGYEQG